MQAIDNYRPIIFYNTKSIFTLTWICQVEANKSAFKPAIKSYYFNIGNNFSAFVVISIGQNMFFLLSGICDAFIHFFLLYMFIF